MPDEHDDDLTPSVDTHGDVETEDFPEAPEADDESENEQANDEELDDEDIVGK